MTKWEVFFTRGVGPYVCVYPRLSLILFFTTRIVASCRNVCFCGNTSVCFSIFEFLYIYQGHRFKITAVKLSNAGGAAFDLRIFRVPRVFQTPLSRVVLHGIAVQ